MSSGTELVSCKMLKSMFNPTGQLCRKTKGFFPVYEQSNFYVTHTHKTHRFE